MRKSKEKLLGEIQSALEIEPSEVKKRLVDFIRNEARNAAASGIVLGMSGGVDSSTLAFLCVDALGGKRVVGVAVPEEGVTDPQDVQDAREIAEALGLNFKIMNITPVVVSLQNILEDFNPKDLPAANLRPRIRMTVLYYYANKLNYLVAGSSNRSEIRAGYFTKFGDGAADLAPLGCFYKTQVLKLAEYLKVPEHVRLKVPSAGLWRGQTDEKELGISYEKLDQIYVGLDLGLKPSEISEAIGVKDEVVKKFMDRESKTRHKITGPKIPSITCLGKIFSGKHKILEAGDTHG